MMDSSGTLTVQPSVNPPAGVGDATFPQGTNPRNVSQGGNTSGHASSGNHAKVAGSIQTPVNTSTTQTPGPNIPHQGVDGTHSAGTAFTQPAGQNGRTGPWQYGNVNSGPAGGIIGVRTGDHAYGSSLGGADTTQSTGTTLGGGRTQSDGNTVLGGQRPTAGGPTSVGPVSGVPGIEVYNPSPFSNPVAVTPGDFHDFVFLGVAFVLLLVCVYLWNASREFRVATAKQARQDRDSVGEVFFVFLAMGVIAVVWLVRYTLVNDLFGMDGSYIFTGVLLKPRPFVPLLLVLAAIPASISAINFAISLPVARVVASRPKASINKSAGPLKAMAGFFAGSVGLAASLITLFVFVNSGAK